MVPFSKDSFQFTTIEEYLNFFINVIVRNSGSQYEYEIAKRYSQFVLNHQTPELIPLLIPEFRYRGLEKKHENRLDFMIIQSENLNKIGFELSPWSSHGQIKRTKDKTQKTINQEASANFENEIDKLRKYFKRYNIYTLVYSDKSIQNIDSIFEDMKPYLEPKTSARQMNLHIYDEILKSDL